jgi:hypothetical protein
MTSNLQKHLVAMYATDIRHLNAESVVAFRAVSIQGQLSCKACLSA